MPNPYIIIAIIHVPMQFLWSFIRQMNILIIGDRNDPHAAHLQQAIAETGAKVDYWNTQQFPRQSRLSWQPDRDRGTLVLPNGYRLDLQQIHSVFWRSFSGVQVPPLADIEQQQVAQNDALSALRSLLQACPAHWVNSWQAYQFHKEKPLQLHAVKQLGVPIPATLISNDPEEVLAFCRSQQQTIFKPVYGGAHTQWVTPEHLHPERLQLALKIAPVTVQAYIAGTNIRSYVIGETVYTAEIRSPSLDFREDKSATLTPLMLPQPVEQWCRMIARRLLLEWTAIDWRLTPDGEYVFLEANPSPMFLYLEQQTGFPITARLVEHLTQPRRGTKEGF
jgi:glutathione synthase/RimK-type ligase-like ATP-grasp enzyme